MLMAHGSGGFRAAVLLACIVVDRRLESRRSSGLESPMPLFFEPRAYEFLWLIHSSRPIA